MIENKCQHRTTNPTAENSPGFSVANGDLLQRIEQVLDQKVRPELEADGGGIVVVGLDPDNILQVRLTGACQGCSSSIVTLSMRVESILKVEVPEIRFVEAVL
jgi:Fe-S cluster biogenesis protein NfuA